MYIGAWIIYKRAPGNELTLYPIDYEAIWINIKNINSQEFRICKISQSGRCFECMRGISYNKYEDPQHAQPKF